MYIYCPDFGWWNAQGHGHTDHAHEAYNHTDDFALRMVQSNKHLKLVTVAEMEKMMRGGIDVVGPQPIYDDGLDFLNPLVKEQSRAGDVGSAKKMDLGKAPIKQGFDRYFANAVFAVSMVSEYGHRKYEPGDVYSGNALRVPNGLARYGDAERRHGVKEDIEGPYDDGDSGLPHLAQKAWNSMMELERAIRDGVIEVRRGNDIVDGKPVLGTAKAVKL